MFHTRCPFCDLPMSLPDEVSGTQVECKRCRGLFVARQLLGLNEPLPDLPKPDGSRYAVTSLILGGLSCLTCCMGFGFFFGIIGFFSGWSGLQSRLRSLSIIGMAASIVGMIFSLTMVALIVQMIRGQMPDAVPNPRGNPAPFFNP